MNFDTIREWFIWLNTWVFIIGLCLLPIAIPLFICSCRRWKKKMDEIDRRLKK